MSDEIRFEGDEAIIPNKGSLQVRTSARSEKIELRFAGLIIDITPADALMIAEALRKAAECADDD